MWKRLFLVYFIVFKDICVAAKTKKESMKDDDEDSNITSNLFQYDCKLPDGRPYKSTIPCPAYTPDGRVVLRAPAGNPNPCANAGRFLNSYCIADYNCNANNQQSNNNQAGQQGNNPQSNSNTSGGQVECIRGYCCTRTSTQKDKVNVRNQQDTSLCTNGGYSMGNTCSQDIDCNPNDGNGRAARGYSLLKCINGNCCSRPYKKPNQNQFCLNGGKSVGQDCVLNDDCRAANAPFDKNNNNNNQRTGNNRNDANNNLGGRLECVEHTCCTQPSFNQPFSDDGGDDSDDDSEDSEEDNVCRNGGRVLRDNNNQIIYCGKHNDCGANITKGRRHAICSNGRCCSNSGKPNGGQPRGSDYRRGTAVCSSLAPAPAIYVGKHCSRASECGYSNYATYSCAGGYCCEEDDELVNPVPGPVSQRDRVCNHQGYYLGINCLEDIDCDPLRQSAARANVCINRSCCSIPSRLDQDGANGADGQFCSGGEYGHYLEETCASTADCPVYAGANGVRIPVRCRGGVCCALGSGRGRYQLNDVGNNPPGISQPGLSVVPRRPAGSVAICYDGSLSAAECPQGHECQNGHSCVNHLCCPKREDERQYVCGGLAANGDCFANGQCRSNLFCTPAKLCCECRYGQPQLGVGLDCRQNAALCKPGYICNSGGFCCPKCPNNEVPFGSCSAGKCGNGYACQPGNICCAAALSYAQALVSSRDRLAYDPYYNQLDRRNGLK